MTTLEVELTFPSAPITSLLKRIKRGIEDFYYARLFLTNEAYQGPRIWRDWLELGFHVAIYSPPPGTSPADRIRVRTRAPSLTPVISLEGSNADALKDLESLLRELDQLRPALAGQSQHVRAASVDDSEFGRQLVAPVVESLRRQRFEAPQIDQYRAMLRRGFDAVTNEEIKSMSLSMS